MSFDVSPEQSRPYDVHTTQPFTCIYSKEINENIGCSQILFIYIHALTRYQHRSTRTCRGERTTLSSALSRGNPEGDRSRTVAGTRRPASSASFMNQVLMQSALYLIGLHIHSIHILYECKFKFEYCLTLYRIVWDSTRWKGILITGPLSC